MNNEKESDDQRDDESRTVPVVCDPDMHRFIRFKAAEWDCSVREAAARILRQVAATEQSQQQTSAA